MTYIYKPKGKAEEYAEGGCALNIYTGCTLGCTYCYNKVGNRFAKDDYSTNPRSRADLLMHIIKEAPKHKDNNVFLSFLSDCYQPIEEKKLLTRMVLLEFKYHNVTPIILTKSKLIIRDFDIISKCQGKIGVTLTHLDREKYGHLEPFASTPLERIEVLKRAKETGIFTWVSLEPIIDLDEVIKIIDATHPYVDLYKVGKWNYSKEAKDFDWVNIAKAIYEKLSFLKKEFVFKKELKFYL